MAFNLVNRGAFTLMWSCVWLAWMDLVPSTQIQHSRSGNEQQSFSVWLFVSYQFNYRHMTKDNFKLRRRNFLI
jgi:hypothetical protein